MWKEKEGEQSPSPPPFGSAMKNIKIYECPSWVCFTWCCRSRDPGGQVATTHQKKVAAPSSLTYLRFGLCCLFACLASAILARPGCLVRPANLAGRGPAASGGARQQKATHFVQPCTVTDRMYVCSVVYMVSARVSASSFKSGSAS